MIRHRNASSPLLLPQNLVYGFALFLITLQSYYFYQFQAPIFSLLGWAMVLALGAHSVFFRRPGAPLWRQKTSSWWLGLISIIVASFIGMFQSNGQWNPKPAFVFLLGWFQLIAPQPITNHVAKKALQFVLLVHVSAFFVQLAGSFLLSYESMAAYLDFIRPVTGESQRFFYQFSEPSSHVLIRPSGLFVEPSIYCLFVSVLYLKWLQSDDSARWIRYLLCTAVPLSLLLSFSLLGWATFVLLLPLTFHYLRAGKTALVATALVSAVSILLWIQPSMLDSAQFFRHRMQNIEQDVSFRERAAGTAITAPSLNQRELFQETFGDGLGNYSRVPGTRSGFHFLWAYFGILGALPLLFLVQNISKVGLLAVSLFLVFAPYLTAPFFWTILPLFRKDEEKEPPHKSRKPLASTTHTPAQ